MRLNTGLVGIITTFLHHEHKGTQGQMKMNYKSLTDLSESSRRDALTSMSQLYQRLSQSQLQLHPALRSNTSQYCESSGNNSDSSKDTKNSTASRRRPSGSHVTRMPVKSSSQPQLCMVRSKSRSRTRRDSTSNNSTSKSKTISKSDSSYMSPYTSPLQSPVPEYAVLDPMIHDRLELKHASYRRGSHANAQIASLLDERQRADSLDIIRPVAWPPHTQPHDYFSIIPGHTQQSTTQRLDPKSTSRKTSSPPSPKKEKAPPIPAKPASLSHTSKAPAHPAAAPLKRRLDKPTLSSYTFASDSTKLGEIPETRWAKPWDYERAEMLNNMAAAAAKVRIPTPVTEEKGKGKEKEKEREKKGLKFWRRTETA